ncbi:MAG: glycosyltransferase [Bacteroidales bacterium]|nr:glycosyltransferase [Bacteroidales bacterium]
MSCDKVPKPDAIRVGFVVHVMQVAGAEVLVRETIRQLGSAIQPTIFCLDAIGKIGEELLADGIDLVCLNRRPGWDFSVSRRLASAIRERQIDVLHAHQYGPFFYSALAKVLAFPDLPRLILTEHGRHYPDVVSPIRRAMNRLILDRLADRVNACCRFSARALSRVDGFAGARIQIIQNGIKLARYSVSSDKAATKAALGLKPEWRYVVHVARHHPIKDQPTLIRGFAQAISDVSQVDLLLVGDGPRRPELEQLVDELGITDRVHFLGIRSDVATILQCADIFVLTSISEAASLTLLEAMATRLPSIVTAVGGNPEIIRDGQEGLHISRGDTAGCAQALVRLLRDPDLALRMGESARRRVEDQYQLEQTITSYHQLYRELALKRRFSTVRKDSPA